MRIKQVAETLNVSQKTIRYYEQCGLIVPEKKRKMGRDFRDYNEEVVERLHTIVVLRRFRFCLEDIRVVLDRPDRMEEVCRRHRNTMLREIGVMTGICYLLEKIPYARMESAEQLSRELERQRREKILDAYYEDYDLSRFDEEFTDHDLFLQETEDHRKFQQTVAAGYYFASPRVRSNLSGSSSSAPR